MSTWTQSKFEKQIFAIQKSDRVGDFTSPEDREIDEFCKIAYKVIGDMGFEAKRSIVRKVVDTIVGTQTDIKVYGHLEIC